MSMSSLLQLLQEVDPAISASMAADLRAALVAVNQQAQADPASADWSLNSWWQWLEDEGYNRDTLLACLQRLCASRLGDAALADLLAACHAHGDDPDGLEWVQTLIGDLDAELIGLFHRLEGESLLEDLQLAQTAGGMSKGGAWGLGVGLCVGIPAIALISYRLNKANKEAKRWNSLETHLNQTIDQTNALIDQQATVIDNKALNAALNDPAELLFAKDAAEYTWNDTFNQSRALAEKHIAKFGIRDYEKVIMGDVEASYYNSPEGLKKVMQESRLAEGGLDHADPNQVKVFLTSSEGEAFMRQTAEFWKTMGWDRLTKEYFQLVQAEVDAAKKAKAAAVSQGDNFIEAARQVVKVDVSSNVGGLVGEVNQAAGAELRKEKAKAENAMLKEEREGQQIKQDAKRTADA